MSSQGVMNNFGGKGGGCGKACPYGNLAMVPYGGYNVGGYNAGGYNCGGYNGGWNAGGYNACGYNAGCGKGGKCGKSMEGMMMQMMNMMMTCMANKGGYGACSSGSSKGSGKTSVNFVDPEEFLAMHYIQDVAAQSFRQLPPNVQQLVIAAGTLKDARDPTAVLIARMAKAKRGELSPQVAQNPGDWFCPGCNDLQFARNLRCRSCGVEKPMPGNYKDMPAAPQEDVDEFLQKNGIQEHAAESFRALPPGIQSLVMSAGGFQGVRDPTAVLISRMAKARQGTLQPEQRFPGDWDCPNPDCGFHNYSKNIVCKVCNTPNSSR